MNTQPQNLYEQDFYAWTLETASALKAKSYDAVDVEHLIEEIECMGASERSQLQNRLEVLIMHLLKLQYQSGYIGKRSWILTIKEQRKRIKRLLQKMPSLKACVQDEAIEAYDYATIRAAKETGITESVFPAQMPYTLEQILDDNFYPESQ
jgi:hypothetical protein